jgi:imidazolonepropionase-like amidohydrolase
MKTTAITGATLIDGTNRPPIRDGTLVILDDRIDAIFRPGEIELPSDADLLDGRGKTVMPGLMDGHTHIAGLADDSFVVSEDPLATIDHFMREYLRNGVTTLRDTGNFDPDFALQHMRSSAGLQWPRWFGAGPVLDGPADPPTPWRWLWVMESEADVRGQVHSLRAKGVDFIKAYMWMDAPLLRALIEEAHSLGLRVSGHLGLKVSVEQGVRLGVDCLEHVRVGPELLTAEGRKQLEATTPRALDPIASWKPWRFIDPTSAAADALIELLAERGTYWNPTLTWSQSILAADLPEVREPPSMDRVPDAVKKTWNEFSYTFDYTTEDFAQAKVELERQMQFVGRAAAGGVRVMCGTDTLNPSVIPGSAVHDELELLVRSGMSPVRAIHAATQLVAEVLGIEAEVGALEHRKVADVLVVDGDVTEDIGNTRNIHALFKAGQRMDLALPA